MWTQDWLHRIRSVSIPSVDPASLEDSAIAKQKSALEDAGRGIVWQDDGNDDFVMIYANRCNQPNATVDTSHVDAPSTKSYPGSDSQRLLEGCEEASTCREHAHILELCGRGDHDHTFQDLRSAAQASKRDKTTRQKYYNFRYVKLGDFEALHGQSSVISDDSRETTSNANPTTTTKSELYRQAQLPPRPPKNHHRHTDKIYGTISQRVDIRREDSKHSKAIMEGHLRDL